MAYEPHDFLHLKKVVSEEGVLENSLMVSEEGADNFKISTSTKFQKYFGKNQAYMYNKGYNYAVDLKNDAFLDSLTFEEKKGFDEEMKKIWAKNAALPLEEDSWKQHWFMILEGRNQNGWSKVALFQDRDFFMKACESEDQTTGWSSKACWFEDLETAKNYIQMARDEEGDHWDWPAEIPVFWKTGPLDDFPGFEEWKDVSTRGF